VRPHVGREVSAHRTAQDQGRKAVFAGYRLRVAGVVPLGDRGGARRVLLLRGSGSTLREVMLPVRTHHTVVGIDAPGSNAVLRFVLQPCATERVVPDPTL